MGDAQTSWAGNDAFVRMNGQELRGMPEELRIDIDRIDVTAVGDPHRKHIQGPKRATVTFIVDDHQLVGESHNPEPSLGDAVEVVARHLRAIGKTGAAYHVEKLVEEES